VKIQDIRQCSAVSIRVRKFLPVWMLVAVFAFASSIAAFAACFNGAPPYFAAGGTCLIPAYTCASDTDVQNGTQDAGVPCNNNGTYGACNQKSFGYYAYYPENPGSCGANNLCIIPKNEQPGHTDVGGIPFGTCGG
jgi:hypothetical protein